MPLKNSQLTVGCTSVHASDSADGSYWANSTIVMCYLYSLMTRRIFFILLWTKKPTKKQQTTTKQCMVKYYFKMLHLSCYLEAGIYSHTYISMFMDLFPLKGKKFSYMSAQFLYYSISPRVLGWSCPLWIWKVKSPP